MAKGWAFWRKDDDGPETHLRFVISDPDAENMVMMVHMTTLRKTGREDISCVLAPKDHPRVTDHSYIWYAKAVEIACSALLNDRHRGMLLLAEDLPPATLQKIQNGARASNALPRKFRRFFALF